VTSQFQVPRCLVLVAPAAWIALIWGWWPAHLTVAVDDAYYYLVIARRIVAGEGVTFDGFERTNGFQPLWLGVETLAMSVVSGTENQMRAVLTVGAVMVGAGLYIRPSTRWGVLLSMLWMVPFHAGKVVINGMESSLVFLLLCVVATGRRRPVLVALALLPMARIDLVAFAVVCGACMVGGVVGNRQGAEQASTLRRMETWLPVILPVAALACWSVFSAFYFGSPFQVSAAVKAGQVTRSGAPVAAGLLLAGGALAWASRRRTFTCALVVQCAVVLAEGAARRMVPEVWHLTPVWILTLMAGEVLASLRGWAAAPIGVAVLAAAGWSWHRRVEPDSWSAYLAAQRAGEWVAENTLKNAVVAGWDVGIAGAFSERRVLQLGGLVNSWQFERTVRGSRTFDDYLVNHGAGYLMQPLPGGSNGSQPHLGLGFSPENWTLLHLERFDFHGLLDRDRSPMCFTVFGRLDSPRR
jgi:hypothetical protein